MSACAFSGNDLARRRRATLALALCLLGIALAAAAPAGAVILPAVTLDGPSEEIVGFGGAAMAEDGTGGVVYLERVAGVPHVFVSRCVGGHWLAPIRVDTAEPYAASWPRIGAADDGELIVVWVTPYATENERPVDELLASTLGPSSSTFGPAIMLDGDVGDGTGTSPDLAVSRSGQADLVYRVVPVTLSAEQQKIPLLRPTDVIEEVRVAHYNGQRWLDLGEINREPGISMRPPTEANAPKIAIGPTGNGIVAWQEPEINGVARIWARRVFGTSLDYVLPVTATSYDGAPINDDADAPSVAFTQLGQAVVAYRQTVGPGSPLPGPRIFVNTLPDGEAGSGAEFLGASVADSDVPGGDAATVGPPSVDIDENRETRLLYDDDGTPRVLEGNDRGQFVSTLSLGPPFDGPEEAPVSVMDPAGGGVSAWPSANAEGDPGVAVREDFPDGAVQTGLVSGGAGGEVAELAVGRSGLGDGLVAFRQGSLGNAAIVATVVSAPPATFPIEAPKGWIKPAQATVSWAEAPSANGPLSYQVVLDGHALPPVPAGALTMRIPASELGSGHHEVQVLATDVDAQSTLTAPITIDIDGEPPTVGITHADHDEAVVVRIKDAYSGVDAHAVSVSFGDGHHASGRARYTHRYAHPGVYEIVAHVRDLAGNAGTVRELVSVR